ncbi:sodium bile acid symporter family protein [Teladorsagia circumcincta]|uniref:Sodium bile acid symporter family protein n=1 Tax=Teladorsagia circumcincta TaxID=45464 RepID=A0A2G9UMB9_TELCI|nr:sodium bile acid symporter family protein [Teladorsagia circumcincta]
MSAVYETIRRPVAPAIGFAAQFVIMPLLAYGIAKTVFVSRGLFSLALGLFITGCSPGGGASNFWTLLLDGNVNLSVTMTFVSTLASLAKITRSLVALVVPLLIGIAIKKWRPLWAAKSRKLIGAYLMLLFVVTAVEQNNASPNAEGKLKHLSAEIVVWDACKLYNYVTPDDLEF